jgi:hypothetical protein
LPAWLTAEEVGAVLGADLTADLDPEKLEEAAAAAGDWVEGKRRDQFVYDDADPPVGTYTPGPAVIYGAALLAHRLYHRTKSPLGILGVTDVGASGILREDPDIARLLGIGKSRGFRFGGPTRVTEEVV